MKNKGLRIARILVLTMAAMSAPLAPALADTLRDAMADAYRNSSLLDQNRYLLRVRDEGVNQAVAALLPTLSFAAASSRDLVADTTTTTARLVAEVTLYAGRSRANAVRAAEETVNAARQQLVALEAQVLGAAGER